jgi:predicted DsbA family dithiol-disulfide isomerase
MAIEVFADIACPFAHAGLARFVAFRHERGRDQPRLRVRAWPLELVNDRPHAGETLAAKVDALRRGVAPDRFGGFDPARFPATTLPALRSEAAAYRTGGVELGEPFSLALRAALWDDGLDVADEGVLADLRSAHGVADPTRDDDAAVHADLADGRGRGVSGSPHFFTPGGDFFCPSLDIRHDDGGEYDVSFDVDGFRRFVDAAFD